MILKTILLLLVISVFLLSVIDIISAHSFMAFYYIIWIGGVGSLVWKYRNEIEVKLNRWSLSPVYKFLILGFGMTLTEEALAAFSIHLSSSLTLASYLHFVSQFWATNMLALVGFVIGWWLLLSRFEYSRREVFIISGIFGLYAEHILRFLSAFPTAGVLLILPTIFTYGVIITPSLLSVRFSDKRKLPVVVRYILAPLALFLMSIPFVVILSFLMKSYPAYFYFAA